MSDTTRELIERMARKLDLYRQMLRDDRTLTDALADEARAFLDQPEPEGLTDEEIEELVDASWVVSLQAQCPDGDGWLISLTPEEFCNAIRGALIRWGRNTTKETP